MASVDREIMEHLLHDARRWIFMVPRRAGECNEGILVYTSGPGLVRGMQQDLKQSTRALEKTDLGGRGRGRVWAKGRRGERAKGRTISSCRLTKCDGCSPAAWLFLVLPHLQRGPTDLALQEVTGEVTDLRIDSSCELFKEPESKGSVPIRR
jgi:hypothetical protein